MKKLRAAVIGAGLRGDVYASYALEHPEELKIVAVAEPDEGRRFLFSEKFHIPRERQFTSWEQLLEAGKLADFVMVCTQDRMHFQPVKEALKAGYHVLCEKPMSPDETEIVEMGQLSRDYGQILSICHVLRYSPFYTRIKRLLSQGAIGQLVSIHSIEEVGYWHYAHSFCRGNWRNSKESSPMILQKCCHDMDILLWLTGKKCTRVQSFGELTYFNQEHAPVGAPKYCMDGCEARNECPFYAPRFYLEHERAEKDGLARAVEPKADREALIAALQHGPYGRCVFHCDNDVVDHQVVNLEFEGGITASFQMCAFTKDFNRRITLMGTRGQIDGNMEEGIIEVKDFVTGSVDTIELNTPDTGHSGSDSALMQDFIGLIAKDQGESSRSGAEVSVDSHLVALAAEKSRKERQTIEFETYKNGILKK